MKSILVIAAAVVGLGVATVATAQVPACKSQGERSAKAVSTSRDLSANMMTALGVGTSLEPETLALVTRDIVCSRGEFALGQDTFTLSGENDQEIPRKAVARRADGPTVFLVPYIDLTAFINEGKKPSGPPARLVMVVMDAKSASAVRLYTALPTDEMLVREFIAALRGLPPMARVDRQSKGVEVFVQTEPTRTPQPPVIPPPSAVTPPGAGDVGVTVLDGPDGEIFTAEAEGARHAASGFLCATQISGRVRDRLMVFDRTDNGRDVGCRYGNQNDRSWYTLYLTKLPGMRAAKVFDAYEAEARAAAPPMGRAQPPLKVGSKPPAPRFASFWKNGAGKIDGLWMTQIGDWHVKLRATFAPEDEAQAKAMAQAIYAAVYAQVKPDQI
jgi:hypothetical protein